MPRDLVVIDESTLRSMLSNAKFCALIPCFNDVNRDLRKQTAGCGKCGRTVKDAQAGLVARGFGCIRELFPEKRTELKKLLDTRKYRIYYRNSAGVVVKMTY
jgi:hypothetical protein